MSRTIAIGDIHGCSIALKALIAAIDLHSDDTIIPLGDHVDRGIDSKAVLDLLIELRDRTSAFTPTTNQTYHGSSWTTTRFAGCHSETMSHQSSIVPAKLLSWVIRRSQRFSTSDI